MDGGWLGACGAQSEHFAHQRIGGDEGGIGGAGAVQQALGVGAALAEGHERFDRIFLGAGTTPCGCPGNITLHGGKLEQFACQFCDQ